MSRLAFTPSNAKRTLQWKADVNVARSFYMLFVANKNNDAIQEKTLQKYFLLCS